MIVKLSDLLRGDTPGSSTKKFINLYYIYNTWRRASMSEQNIKAEPEWKKDPLIKFAMWVEDNEKLDYASDHDKCIGTYRNAMECVVRCGKALFGPKAKIVRLFLVKDEDRYKFILEHERFEFHVIDDSFDKGFEWFKKIIEMYCYD